VSVFYKKKSPPHGSVRVRTHVVGRLGLGLGSGSHVVCRLGSGMRVSGLVPVFSCIRSLYIDWRMVVVVGAEMLYTRPFTPCAI